MRGVKLFGLGVALVLFALAAGNSGQVGLAQADCTITVRPGQSIQQAINNAAEGVVICLSAGEFQENVVIRKALTLRAEGAERSLIRGSEKNRPIVWIAGEEPITAAIQGMTFAKDDPSGGCADSVSFPNCSIAIYLDGQAQARLLDLQILGHQVGLALADSAQATVQNSKFSGDRFNRGIWLSESTKATVMQTRITSYETGIYIESGAVLNVSESLIQQGGIGIRASGLLDVRNTTLTENRTGILFSGAQLRLEGSKLQNNSYHGLSVARDRSEGLLLAIRDTTFSGNGVFGVEVCFEYACDGKIDATLQGVKITANGIFGLVFGTCRRSVRCRHSLTLTDSEITTHGSSGLEFIGGDQEPSQLVVENTTVSYSGGDGISVRGFAEAMIQNSHVVRNAGTALAVNLFGGGSIALVHTTIQFNSVGLDAKPQQLRECRANTITQNLTDFASSELMELCSQQTNGVTAIPKAAAGMSALSFFSPASSILAKQGTRHTTTADCTRNLQPGDSIQQAITELSPGSVLCLASGTYQENISIDKALTLRGEFGVTLEAARLDAPIISIHNLIGAVVQLEDLRVRGAKDGIYLEDLENSRIHLQKLQLSDNRTGIRIVSIIDSELLVIESFIEAASCGVGRDGFANSEVVHSQITIEESHIHGGSAALCFDRTDSLQLFLRGSVFKTTRDPRSTESISVGANSRLFIKDSDLRDSPIELGEAAQASIEDSRMGDVKLKDAAQAIIKNASFERGGLELSGAAQANVSGSSFVQGEIGIGTKGANQLQVQDSWFAGNRVGLALAGVGGAVVRNVRALGNLGSGLLVEGTLAITITDSTFAGNGTDPNCHGTDAKPDSWCIGVGIATLSGALMHDVAIRHNASDGLWLIGGPLLGSGDFYHVEIRDSIIEGNGTASYCSLLQSLCNGITLMGAVEATITRSTIQGNADWGVAAVLRVCGYPFAVIDLFIGRVLWEGQNALRGNNASGNQDGLGNPGNHPFKNLPDGQVCLP
jgi:nitrous oxidase accessory protein NosD